MPRAHPPSDIGLARAVEWPTLGVTIAVYASWLAATAWNAVIPSPLLFALGGWILAWHGSLQHETIHGHPTGNRIVDRAIGFMPLSLWLPYATYRRSHIAHHGSRAITDPHLDPESRYVGRPRGAAWLAARLEATLAGHMLLGPPIAVVRFVVEELRRGTASPVKVARDWIPHLLGVTLLLAWLDHVGMGIGHYILFFVYPGMVLTMLRSHAEHRADLSTAGRAATVERGGLFALLFLNNNLHAAHHEHPQLAWYRLPAHHRRSRARLISEGALLYNGYGEIARRFAWRVHDEPVHPRYRGEAA